ncbi:hypothetical protein FRC10_001403 [Ceratobasidium sp. 414]|nr:hypothetical protein FRC10_001403 [Ceratobasidium sp. 414]
MNESDQAIVPREGDIIEYFPGVGADNAHVTAMDLLARALGHTTDILIRKIYTIIAHSYEDGDNISSLFGYSRGAFIVRKVASLIDRLGLIKDEIEFDGYWNTLLNPPPGPLHLPLKPHVAPIRSSLQLPRGLAHRRQVKSERALRPMVIREKLNLFTLPDDDLPEIVQLALHAVGYHENRKLFDVTLFNTNNNNNDKQLCKQTLFPGCHSDVGFVDPERKIIADVTLDWMLRNMPQTIQVALREKLESEVPSWYPIKSALHATPFWKRIADELHHREYLPTMHGLLWHRTLLGLPPPKSLHLPKHMWRHTEYFNSVEEENIGRPASKQLPPPKQPPQSADTTQNAEPRVPQERHPTLITWAPRLESGTTDRTNFTTDTLDTVLTARTSPVSVDALPEIRDWQLIVAPRADLHRARIYHVFNNYRSWSKQALDEPSSWEDQVTQGLAASSNGQITADKAMPAPPPAEATPLLPPIPSGSSVVPLRTASGTPVTLGTDREAPTNVAAHMVLFQGEIRAGAVYHIFNKKYGTAVRIPEDAYQADLVGYRRTKNVTLGYKGPIVFPDGSQWKMEPDMRNTAEYRIYNVDFKRYAKLGHSSPDSVQTGRRDGDNNDNDGGGGDDDDDDWWVIEPVLGKENCFTYDAALSKIQLQLTHITNAERHTHRIAHYVDPVYWGLVDKRNRTPITLRKSLNDSANHWEFELVQD